MPSQTTEATRKQLILEVVKRWENHSRQYSVKYPEEKNKIILDLIEVQLQSLLKQLDFNSAAYVSEFNWWDGAVGVAGKKHLLICIKSFNLAIHAILAKHGIVLLSKIQPRDEAVLEELLNRSEKTDLNWHKYKDEIFDVSENYFGDINELKMTHGGSMKTPYRLIMPGLSFLDWMFNDDLCYTSGSCAIKAQEFLLTWEKQVLEELVAQIREELHGK